MKKYFSQYRQDEFIDKVIFNKKSGGFFVDIGAHDGISFSNSYFFETSRAFNGLCIEPNPKVFEQLKKNRQCDVLNACIGDTAGIVKFLAIEGYSEMLSGIIDHYHPAHLDRINNSITEHGDSKTEIEVICTPLQNIAALTNTEIDYMSIDTEGNEYSILKSIDFTKLKVTCLSIENNYDDAGIENIMAQNGYAKIYRLGDDDIYLIKNKYTLALKLRRSIFMYLAKGKFYLSKLLK